MSASAADFSAAEFVKTLSDEQKEEVFFAITREVLALYPKSGAVPIQPEGEAPLGHLLTPLGVQQLTAKYGADCLPEWEVPPEERVGSTPRGLTIEEVWAQIDAEEEAQDAESRSRAAG